MSNVKNYNRCIKCGIRQHENFSDVTFHSIRPEKKDVWLRCLGLSENTYITVKSKVCIRHFGTDSFKNPESKKKRLKDDANPNNVYPCVVSI